MPKRVATESEDQGELEETNDEGGEISTTASQPAEVAELPVKPTASTSTTVKFIIIIIIWLRPFLKWPNLKCHVGHLTHFP